MVRTPIQRADSLLSGAVAKCLGIGVQTLHYYERERLIPPPPRTQSGYRLYSPELVERVRFIRKAQALGLPLGEVKDVLRLAEAGSNPCGRVQEALAAKLREVNQRMRELENFRDELAKLVRRAPARGRNGGAARVCAIVEEVSSVVSFSPFPARLTPQTSTPMPKTARRFTTL